ncbi:MAG: hypothetical protein AMS16_05955 [Planctomycetes bacterium DG_58]|nr:MAG: hypothetical protein AMS16_05955 [Planctomycetes bacterium DG_58]
MTLREPREFKFGMTGHRKVLIVLHGLCAAMFTLAGVGGLINGKAYGLIWLLGAVIWLLGVFVLVRYTKMPYLRVSADELAVFPGMIARPRFCRWDAVKRMNEIDAKKVELVPKSGEKVTVYLTAVAQEEREELLALLRQHVGTDVSRE